MGECFITRRGGTIEYMLPILDANYPQDATVLASKEGESISFSVVISKDGKPAKYNYQWYINGEAIDGATDSVYTLTGLTSVSTKTIYCVVTNEAGDVTSRLATVAVQSPIPSNYSYEGQSELIEENEYDWQIKLKSSGILTLPRDMKIDVFLCGGGGGGGSGYGGGGGGGYTTNIFDLVCQKDEEYVIVVGDGGTAGISNNSGGRGNTSSAFDNVAFGGYGGTGYNVRETYNYVGGNGGSGGGNGNCSVANGGNGASNGGNTLRSSGQGTTTKPFADASSSDLYGSGGAGGYWDAIGSSAGSLRGGGVIQAFGGTSNGQSASNNTGGGGAGGSVWGSGGKGGSGIVIIRNAR